MTPAGAWTGATTAAMTRRGTNLTDARYLDVAGLSTYISKSPEGVRMMVKRSQIPYARIGRSIRFDREVVDKWMARHANKGKAQ